MGGKTSNETGWDSTFNAICKRTYEIDREVFKQMHSICRNAKIEQFVNETEIELRAALDTKGMQDVFKVLDWDFDSKIYVDFESSQLLTYIDRNGDGRIDR
jgi:hypothetical protein